MVVSLNQQEGTNGIKACHLWPGDMDTHFLSVRPQVPDWAQPSEMPAA
ncbi:hypothetical protein [Arthrobacter sp. DR-2P]|nr:hypothetical protein [Arthrobacter sp. DR-2P]